MRLKRGLAHIAVTMATLTALATAVGISTQAAQAAAVGWGPSDLQSAYQLPTNLNPGMTVAVVAPYNDAKAATDLAAYRSNYGLSTCNATGSCFTEFDEGAPYHQHQPSHFGAVARDRHEPGRDLRGLRHLPPAAR